MAVGIASLDHEVTTLNKADIGKPLPYTTQCLSIGTFRSDPEIANAYPLIRLGKRHAKRCGLRPCRCRAAEQRDELAPVHSITSSAAASNLSGTVRPSIPAVEALMTSSNLLDCTCGIWAKTSPRGSIGLLQIVDAMGTFSIGLVDIP